MKIVQVINAMITNQSKIENVVKINNSEYFFLYNNKHKWSIIKNDGIEHYYLHLYPDATQTMNSVLSNEQHGIQNEYVTYSTEDLKTNEAIESFRELYQIVSSKLYGIDDIFDEILEDDLN